MSRISETTWEDAVVEDVSNRIRYDDAAKRHVAGVYAFCERDQVRNHVEGVDCEPFANSSEASHDLIGDIHNTVLVAQRADAGKVADGWNQNAVGANNCLDDNRSNRGGTFQHNYVLKVFEGPLRLLELSGRVEGGTIQVRAKEMRDRRGCCAVVRTVHRQNLAATGREAGHADCVLICIGAAVGEEYLVERTRCFVSDELREFPADIVCDRWLDSREPTGLTLYRGDEVRVLMPEVQIHQL